MNFRQSRVLLSAGFACLLATPAVTFSGHLNTVLIAKMDGREEVGDDPTQRLVGDPDGSGIGYVFGIDNDPFTLCYSLLVEKIQLVPISEGLAAHIHEGQRDSNGPVVAALAGPDSGNAADCLTEGEEGKFPTGESGIVQRILDNPADFYINVHTPEFPAGAIRGNLSNTIDEDDGHSHDAGGNGSPTTPANLNASVYSRTAVEVFWDRSSDDGVVLMYEVYRDGQLVASVAGNSYFEDTLVSGTTYSYSVVAVDNDNNRSNQSSALSVTTL